MLTIITAIKWKIEEMRKERRMKNFRSQTMDAVLMRELNQ